MTVTIGRRELLAALGGAAAAWPLAARAQQPAMPVVGFVNPASPSGSYPPLPAFLKGLGETGFVEGRNVSSNIAGQRDTTNACLPLSPIWSNTR